MAFFSYYNAPYENKATGVKTPVAPFHHAPAEGADHLCHHTDAFVLRGRTIWTVKLLIDAECFGTADSRFILRGLLLLL